MLPQTAPSERVPDAVTRPGRARRAMRVLAAWMMIAVATATAWAVIRTRLRRADDEIGAITEVVELREVVDLTGGEAPAGTGDPALRIVSTAIVVGAEPEAPPSEPAG